MKRWAIAAALSACTFAGCSHGASGSGTAPTASPAPAQAASPSETQSPSPAVAPTALATASQAPAALPSVSPSPPNVAAVSSASPSPAASSTPALSPVPTENPNLLTYERGTFVRRWSVGSLTYGPESLPAGNGWSPDGPASVTPELVYELPAVARISQFVVTAGLPARPPARIDVGVSTANDRDFTPAGTVTLTPQGGAG